MPVVREQGGDKVIAILCADIHLSANPPRARREEIDWFQAMKRPLDQVAELSSFYNAPILCAGDVFDHWKAEPHLVNFALRHMPEMYATPGQHDLPLHNIDLIEKSAFWTLCLSGRIVPVITKEPVVARNGLIIHGFPWGRKLRPLEKKVKGKFHVALVHDFFWRKGYTHPKAPRSQHMSKYKELAAGYDAIVFGDNHKGFEASLDGVPAWNCGTLMRRREDDKEYLPRVGLLCDSGRILTHSISAKNEKFKTIEEDFEGERRTTTSDMADLLHGLKEAQAQNFDYVEAVEFLMEKYSVKNQVRKILLEALNRD